MIDWSIWLGIGVGGAFGALGRAGCLKAADAFVDRSGSNPSTAPARGLLIANSVGCFGIGLLAGDGVHLPDWVFLMLAVGFCGSLTTFSTLCAQIIQQLRAARGLRNAALYLGMSLLVGYGALYLGFAVGA